MAENHDARSRRQSVIFEEPPSGGFKCAGLWKVYGDEEKARSLFEKYRKCTEIYCTLWQSGLNLEQLAVAV